MTTHFVDPRLSKPRVLVPNFLQEISEQLKLSERGRRSTIDEEFEMLQQHEQKKYGSMSEDQYSEFFAASLQNRALNRYSDVLANEHSRYRLQSLENDYINANLIVDYDSGRQYLVTQGPKPNGFALFWLAIAETRCPVVLCLTRLEEAGISKCDEYWPTDDSEFEAMSFFDGKLIVKSLGEESAACAGITKRLFSVELQGTPQLIVTHLHYTEWPDHGIPRGTKAFLRLVELTNVALAAATEGQQQHGPVCVHCSAGIGRTGTFCAVDLILQQWAKVLSTCESASLAASQFSIDLLKTVHLLRDQRAGMVQRKNQYQFAYQVLLEYFSQKLQVVPSAAAAEAEGAAAKQSSATVAAAAPSTNSARSCK